MIINRSTDTMRGTPPGAVADGAPRARYHGVRLVDHVTAHHCITLEQYRRGLTGAEADPAGEYRVDLDDGHRVLV